MSGGLIYATWVSGTLLGTLGTLTVRDVERVGLDVVFPMLFFLLLTDQVGSRLHAWVAATASIVGLVVSVAVSTSVGLLAAIAIALAVGFFTHD